MTVSGNVRRVETDEVAELAALVLESYSPAALETGVTEPRLVELPDGSRALTLPRDQMDEPFRSLRLIDAAALGPILVITFGWDSDDDGTIFVMPFDTRDLDLDMADNIAVSAFLARHLEFTLGGHRASWEARSVLIGRRLAIVRPWTAG